MALVASLVNVGLGVAQRRAEEGGWDIETLDFATSAVPYTGDPLEITYEDIKDNIDLKAPVTFNSSIASNLMDITCEMPAGANLISITIREIYILTINPETSDYEILVYARLVGDPDFIVKDPVDVVNMRIPIKLDNFRPETIEYSVEIPVNQDFCSVYHFRSLLKAGNNLMILLKDGLIEFNNITQIPEGLDPDQLQTHPYPGIRPGWPMEDRAEKPDYAQSVNLSTFYHF